MTSYTKQKLDSVQQRRELKVILEVRTSDHGAGAPTKLPKSTLRKSSFTDDVEHFQGISENQQTTRVAQGGVGDAAAWAADREGNDGLY